MAESSCSVMSNSINTQNQVSAVQRINQTEDSDKTEKVMEPMLIEDYKYGETPKVIANLLGYFTRNKLSPDKNDLVVGFIYVMMLECGFVHKDCTQPVGDCDFNYRRVLQLSESMPDNWKTHSNYRLDFVLKSTPQHLCSVTCVALADDLLINCVIKNLATLSMIIDPLTYFTSSNTPIGAHMFQNLKSLSRIFKNSIAVPAKMAIVAETGGVYACLQDLPHELLVNVLGYLKIPDVLNLAKTNRMLCHQVQDVTLWTKLLDADFKKKGIFKTYEELKFLYEIKYARELTKILQAGPYNK